MKIFTILLAAALSFSLTSAFPEPYPWRYTNDTCMSGEWKCDNQQCIFIDFRCNGYNDCLDGSDEINCENHTCMSRHWKCDNHRCIFGTWRCDGNNDCGDGSDERNCENHTCVSGLWQCDNQRCISDHEICDRNNNCGDGSDEKNCVITVNDTCESGSWRCDNHVCIHPFSICNGNNDCGDGSDERNCENHICVSGLWQCDNGECIPEPGRCDGDILCDDGSDERNCENVTCMTGKLKCPNANKCISESWLCDGDNDCGDNFDESNCQNSTTTCGGSVVGASGEITSPDYPAHYPIDSDCEYVIVSPVGTVISMQFTYMDVEFEKDCGWDFVVVHDGDSAASPPLDLLCGSQVPATVYKSSGNFLTVHFKSDSSVIGGGWKANFSSEGAGGACTQGFTQKGGVCYRYIDELKSWDDAEASCAAMGAFLAEPKTLEENVHIKEVVLDNHGGDAWIGGKETDKEAPWHWATSGSRLDYTYWADGEPNDHGDLGCVHVWKGRNYLWADTKCGNKFHFVCQMQ